MSTSVKAPRSDKVLVSLVSIVMNDGLKYSLALKKIQRFFESEDFIIVTFFLKDYVSFLWVFLKQLPDVSQVIHLSTFQVTQIATQNCLRTQVKKIPDESSCCHY